MLTVALFAVTKNQKTTQMFTNWCMDSKLQDTNLGLVLSNKKKQSSTTFTDCDGNYTTVYICQKS